VCLKVFFENLNFRFKLYNQDDVAVCVANKRILLFGDSFMGRISRFFTQKNEFKKTSQLPNHNQKPVNDLWNPQASLSSPSIPVSQQYTSFTITWRLRDAANGSYKIMIDVIKDALSKLQSGEKLDYIIVGHAIHDAHWPLENEPEFRAAVLEIVTELRKLLAVLKDDGEFEWKTKVIWALPHMQVDSKKTKHVSANGNLVMANLNRVFREILTELKFPFIDFFFLTQEHEHESPDGTHYDVHTNALWKFQFLLNDLCNTN
jgi:hypothetical protein